MAAEEEKSSDFYGVMGLKKECTPAELRNAYKKLAMKWHPDRCSASANQKYVEQAKKKFQDIQQAYSVLSDANKRFLYDVGVYNSDDDDDENGIGDFLNEMASMMNQTKSNESKNESFEDLQQLFQEIFQSETADALCSSFSSSSRSTSPPSCASSQDSNSKTSKKKRKSSEVEGLCIREKTMAGGGGGGGGGSRKQKVSDVSSSRRGIN